MATPEDAARAWRRHIAPKHRLNRDVLDQHECTCGASGFPSYYKLLDHTVRENPSVDTAEPYPPIDPDLVTNMLGAKIIENSPIFLKPIVGVEIDHTWKWEEYVDGEVYECKCGATYSDHSDLMDHTAKKNPSIPTYELGRAGVAIERSAHEATLKQFKRAIEILKTVSAYIAGNKWSHGPKCQAVEGTPYIECECELNKLTEVYCKEIQPFLQEPRTWE